MYNGIQAIGKLDGQYSKATKLREFKRDKAYYNMLNKQNSEKGDQARATIKVWTGWCRSRQTKDAEKYYDEKVRE